MKSIGLISIISFCIVLFSSGIAESQETSSDPASYSFIKQELNTGLVFSFGSEREELRTDVSRFFDQQKRGSAAFRWENRTRIFLPHRQETWGYRLEAGPWFGQGDIVDSSVVQKIDAGQKLTGIRGTIQVNYNSRFYFDQKNYTLISIDAWGNYDLFRRNAEGSLTDSNQVTMPYSEISEHSKFRYGFHAKAGWGIGRLNPVNHFVAATWLLETHYPGRLFSKDEIVAVAREIGRIKHQRNARSGHSSENEVKLLTGFLRKEMLLKAPETIEPEWLLTEFRPRFEGTRFEFGPFFNYFNREPDFVYGGYIKFENQKYCSLNRNRSFSAALSYNGYKRSDWILLETVLGWNFYPNLQNEYGFGVKYVPGMTVNGFDNLGTVRHNFIPYFEYFSQMSSKYRIETALAWRFAPNEQFMQPGPEVTVSVYRSKY